MVKALVLCASLGACAVAADETPDVDDAPQAITGDSSTYFWVVRDGQPCTAAGCGYFIARVNRVLTWCADRRPRLFCHVDALDLSAIEMTEAERAALDEWLERPLTVIVRGWFEATPPDGAWARVVAGELWVAGAARETPLGLAVKVEPRDVTCDEEPCADKDETIVNVGTRRRIAILDFRPADATADEELHALGSLWSDDEGLIVVGSRYFVWRNGAILAVRTVTQFYTRWPPSSDGAMGAAACEAMGGIVRGDIGDGQIQCEPDETFVGRVFTGIEGGVCCLP